jgi:hypothetical protein
MCVASPFPLLLLPLLTLALALAVSRALAHPLRRRLQPHLPSLHPRLTCTSALPHYSLSKRAVAFLALPRMLADRDGHHHHERLSHGQIRARGSDGPLCPDNQGITHGFATRPKIERGVRTDFCVAPPVRADARITFTYPYVQRQPGKSRRSVHRRAIRVAATARMTLPYWDRADAAVYMYYGHAAWPCFYVGSPD